MKLRIHRGAKEIGGNCIELNAAGKTLLLDLGMPLSVPDSVDVPLPDVK
jgi:ribonuclease J